jgi:hypothetical protein
VDGGGAVLASAAGRLPAPVRGRGGRGEQDARGFVLGTPAEEIGLHRARLEEVAFLERPALDHLHRLGIALSLHCRPRPVAAGVHCGPG